MNTTTPLLKRQESMLSSYVSVTARTQENPERLTSNTNAQQSKISTLSGSGNSFNSDSDDDTSITNKKPAAVTSAPNPLTSEKSTKTASAGASKVRTPAVASSLDKQVQKSKDKLDAAKTAFQTEEAKQGMFSRVSAHKQSILNVATAAQNHILLVEQSLALKLEEAANSLVQINELTAELTQTKSELISALGREETLKTDKQSLTDSNDSKALQLADSAVQIKTLHDRPLEADLKAAQSSSLSKTFVIATLAVTLVASCFFHYQNYTAQTNEK